MILDYFFVPTDILKQISENNFFNLFGFKFTELVEYSTGYITSICFAV